MFDTSVLENLTLKNNSSVKTKKNKHISWICLCPEPRHGAANRSVVLHKRKTRQSSGNETWTWRPHVGPLLLPVQSEYIFGMNSLHQRLWGELTMETKKQSKLLLESKVPKARSIDRAAPVEKGHIWHKPFCFPFFNLSNLCLLLSFLVFESWLCSPLVRHQICIAW